MINYQWNAATIFRLRTGIAAGVVLSMVVGLAPAQAPKPTFEAVAIRSADLPTPDTMRSGQFRVGTTINQGSADFEFMTLADLLPYAYRVKSFQVIGPQSLRESRWRIRAKLPEGASKDQIPEMVQAMLVDRFKLAVHHEKRELPVYELVVLKGGPKLKPAETSDVVTADDAVPGPPGLFPFGGPGSGPPGGGPAGGRGAGAGGNNGPPTGDGRGGRGMMIGSATGSVQISPDENCGMHLEFKSLTMSGLADTLSPFLDKPVIDGTGIKGSYQASLKLPMDLMFAMMQNTIRNANLPPPPGGAGPGDGPGGRGGGPGGRGGPGGGPGGFGCDAGGTVGSDSDASSAALFKAVQQLGLKLQARKAPIDVIVVDRFEKTPSEN
jgi:uncharacterized protein (TIGR03435 family)